MLPPRTAPNPPQHLVALAKANQVRADQSAVRREIGALDRAGGARLLALMLRHENPTVMKMRVDRTLMSVRGVGATGARLVLRKAGVSVGAIHVGNITPRQRGVIADELLRFYTPPGPEL